LAQVEDDGQPATACGGHARGGDADGGDAAAAAWRLVCIRLRSSSPADPAKATPSPSDTIDRPADLTAWLREHPRFDAAKARPVTVAGYEGVVWDTAVKAGAGGENCPRACVFLFQLDGQPIVDLEGSTTRSYVLDVDGRTVGVAILAPTHAFERLAPRAEAVLETLEFAA
jgi:hypothetical protein